MEKGVVECEIFGEIFGGFNLFLELLEKGVVEFHFFFWGGGKQPWEKGVWRFEIALGLFFVFFWGGQALEKGIHRFEIALGFFLMNFYWRQALKNAVWRFEIALGFF